MPDNSKILFDELKFKDIDDIFNSPHKYYWYFIRVL